MRSSRSHRPRPPRRRARHRAGRRRLVPHVPDRRGGRPDVDAWRPRPVEASPRRVRPVRVERSLAVAPACRRALRRPRRSASETQHRARTGVRARRPSRSPCPLRRARPLPAATSPSARARYRRHAGRAPVRCAVRRRLAARSRAHRATTRSSRHRAAAGATAPALTPSRRVERRRSSALGLAGRPMHRARTRPLHA